MVYNKQLQPFIIVECETTGVDLSQEVLEQASRYNLILNVEYVFITNGLNDQLYKSGAIINDLPRFDEFWVIRPFVITNDSYKVNTVW